MKERNYELVRKLPVARFYYKGSHSHPIRRTVVLIKNETSADILVGYELREGKTVRQLSEAPVKSYRRNKIAKFGDYSRLRYSKLNKSKNLDDSTLVRTNLLNLLISGA